MTIEEVLNEYFKENKDLQKMQKNLAKIQGTIDSKEIKVGELGKELYHMMQKGGCQVLTFEVDGKMKIIQVDTRSKNIIILEPMSIKDVKTVLAVEKLQDSDGTSTKEENNPIDNQIAENINKMLEIMEKSKAWKKDPKTGWKDPKEDPRAGWLKKAQREIKKENEV